MSDDVQTSATIASLRAEVERLKAELRETQIELEAMTEQSDLVEDPEGAWHFNGATNTVYRTSTYSSVDQKRYKAVTTWHQRMVREAYRIADAMLVAREAK